MKRASLTQKGFSGIEGLLILIIVGIIGATGYYVYNANKKSNDDYNKAAKAASAKVTVSRKKTAGDESAKWLVYKSPSNKYTIKIPDGWALKQNSLDPDGLLITDKNNLAIVPGKIATVTVDDAINKNASSSFVLEYVDKNDEGSATSLSKDPSNVGAKQSSLITKSGLTIEKYSYTKSSDGPPVDMQIGAQSYTYFVSKGNNNLRVQYTFDKDQTDYHENVEKALKTVQIN